MCWGREASEIQDNLVKDSVRLLVVCSRTDFCPSEAACPPPAREGGSEMPGLSKVKTAAWDVESRGSLSCLRKIPRERGLT